MALKSGFPITLSQIPKQGPKGFPVTLDFTGITRIETDFMLEAMSGQEDFIQSIYVNNAANGNSVTFVISPMNYSILVKANQQGIWAIVGDGRRVIITATAGMLVPCILCNVQIGPSTWAI